MRRRPPPLPHLWPLGHLGLRHHHPHHSRPLYNALVIRDRHCRFPGCDRPAAWGEGHHLHPWQAGGPTSITNLVLLCSRHHHLLHTPRWHAKLLPDNTLEITHPTGHIRTSTPPHPHRAPPLPLRE
jgi:hypothetical protein